MSYGISGDQIKISSG